MTQTLERELRLKFEEVLKTHMGESMFKFHLGEELAKSLAKAAKEVRAFQPKTIEEAIYANVPITEEIVKTTQLRDVAPKMFERALGFTKPLPWFTNKEWEEFGQWVCDRYEESKTAFGEYNVWRNTQYTKGGMVNTRIRGFVREFYDSWDMFMMSKPKKTDEVRPEYKPFPQV